MRKTFYLILLLLAAGGLYAQEELRLARQYFQQEDYEKALRYLEPLQGNNDRSVYELSFNSYLALEEYRDAEKLIENYIRLSRGNHYDYYADLVFVYLEQDKSSKADKVIEEIKERIVKSPGTSYGFANAFQRKGYPRIALELYKLAEQYVPNANYDYQKALLYGELGDVKKMYGAYVMMIKRQPSYLNTVKQLLGRALDEESSSENTDYLKELLIREIQGGGPETLNELLVFIFVKEKNFSGAFTQLRALDKRRPGNKAELFELGEVALNNEEYLLARRVFDYIIKSGPESPFYESALVYDLKAEKLRLQSQPDAGRDAWLAVQGDYFKVLKKLKGQPEVGELSIELADLTAFQLNQTDTAIAILERIITTGYIGLEDQARAKIKLADILLYSGDRWNAIIYYTQAEKAFEQSPIGQEAKFKRARAAYYVGDFQWAQGIFNALKASTSKLIANDALYYSILITDNIALDTNSEAMSMYARADLLNYQNQKDSALEVLEMMEIAFPGHSIQDEVLLLKSRILSGQKRYREAVEDLRLLINQHADDILADDALYELGLLYELHLNDPGEAQKLYEEIFSKHPDSFYASEARKRYRQLRGDILN